MNSLNLCLFKAPVWLLFVHTKQRFLFLWDDLVPLPASPHSSNAPPQFMHMGNMVPMGGMAPAQPHSGMAFAPHPSLMSVAPPPPAPAPHKNEDDDDEDYDS